MEGYKSIFVAAALLAMIATAVQSTELDTCRACPGGRRRGSGVMMEVEGHGMDAGLLMFSFLPSAKEFRDLLYEEVKMMEEFFHNDDAFLSHLRNRGPLPSGVRPSCHMGNPAASVVSQLTSVALYLKAMTSQREAGSCWRGVQRYVNVTLQMTLCSWELVHRTLDFRVPECACAQSISASALPEDCTGQHEWSYRALVWAHERVSRIVSTVEACAFDFPLTLSDFRQWRWARHCLQGLLE